MAMRITRAPDTTVFWPRTKRSELSSGVTAWTQPSIIKACLMARRSRWARSPQLSTQQGISWGARRSFWNVMARELLFPATTKDAAMEQPFRLNRSLATFLSPRQHLACPYFSTPMHTRRYQNFSSALKTSPTEVI